MGSKLLTITLGSLLVIWVIDLFTSWYSEFLKKWMPNIKIRVLLGQLVWAILAVSFWLTLYREHLPETFTLTYFFFVLFIYSVRGLVHALVKGDDDG
ncbi:MAG: hypothetical protein ACE5HO_05865 [bacterium]